MDYLRAMQDGQAGLPGGTERCVSKNAAKAFAAPPIEIQAGNAVCNLACLAADS